MSNYRQLTREQRYQIYALMKARVYQKESDTVVGVHKSTISREIRRNRGLRGYRPKQAQCLAEIRREEAKLNHEFLPTHGLWLNDSSARTGAPSKSADGFLVSTR